MNCGDICLAYLYSYVHLEPCCLISSCVSVKMKAKLFIGWYDLKASKEWDAFKVLIFKLARSLTFAQFFALRCMLDYRI